MHDYCAVCGYMRDMDIHTKWNNGETLPEYPHTFVSALGIPTKDGE
jgi:hypothetical protein